MPSSRFAILIALGAACALAGAPDASGQTLRDYQRSARKMLAEGDSVGALGIYRQAFDGVEQVLDPKARYEMAELAEGLRYYTIAKQQYAVVAASDRADEFADVRLRLADAQRRTGAYPAAKSNYEAVIAAAAGSETPDVLRARSGIEATDWALSRVTRMDSVEVTQLPPAVNTNNSEFAPFVAGERLYFSRLGLRDYRNRELGTTTDVLALAADGSDTLALEVALHPGQHVAHTTLTEAGDRVVFTVCENVDLAEYRCDLYSAPFADGRAGTAEKLGGDLNRAGASQTHPSMGFDPATGQEALYFASDRPGGSGKMDLYMARLEPGGRFATPRNLAAANTPEDDVTPFYHAGTRALFFSSKGHETLGGFDIQRVRHEGGAWGAVTGLRAPINSTFDDTYYALVSTPARTYFSSNRPGATCEATEIRECCGFDLYSVDLAIELEVLTFDALDSAALAETNVILYDLATGREIVRFTDASNLANFPVELGRDYRLVATRAGYGNDTLEFDTRDIYQPTLISQEMYLPPVLQLELYTFNSITRAPLNGVRVQFTELGTRDTILRIERDGNLFKFPVEYGRAYAARGTRAGFSPDATTISTLGSRGTGRVLRDTLYLAPFSPLPLVLYFDNDHPVPNSTEPTTSLAYGETVPGYLAREPKFLRYARGRGNSASKPEMAAFFDEVERNHEKLIEFSGTLVKYLREGNEIDIVLEGYASPLAQTDYNEALTSRRTRSLINHFVQWESGALLAFLRTGQLRIRQEPLGERQAPAGISDSPRNRVESEYGLKASRERKVRIIDIQRRDDLPLSEASPRGGDNPQNTRR